MTDRTRRPASPAGAPVPRRPARPAADGSRRASSSWSLAIVGSIAYMAYTVTVRDTSQIPLLASGAVVLAIVFGALAAYCLRSIWRSGTDERGGRTILVALVGGGAAIAAAGFAAGAIILFQVASG